MLARQVINRSFNKIKDYGTLSSNYSTKRVCTFNTQKAKKYAPDGTGTHKAQINTLCKKTDCETQNCNTPCDEIVGAEITGNYTHSKIIKNKPKTVVKKVADTDFNGNQKKQYFAKMPKKIKISKSDLSDMTEHDISTDKEATKMINADANILKDIS